MITATARPLAAVLLGASLILTPVIVATPTAAAGAPVSIVDHPVVPADPAGRPLKDCGLANDGENVWTHDANGTRATYICSHNTSVIPWHPDTWEWQEIIEA